MTVKVVTLEESELEEMLRRAATFGATKALEKFQTAPIPEVMDKKDLCKYLKCNVSKINRLMSKGMPHHTFGDHPRFYKSEIDKWLKGDL